MIERYFDDPRHRRSEELAFDAERTERAGDVDTALATYAEAARLEETSALAIGADAARVRSLFAVSAVALWLRAQRWDHAARAGCAFLARPETLTLEGCVEIQSLVERAWRALALERVIGAGAAYVPLEVKLSGGQVRTGLAPSTVVAERRDVLAPLLLRIAEWQGDRKYRKGGTSAFASSYDFLEAPAVASSYALRLYVTGGTQQVPGGTQHVPGGIAPSPHGPSSPHGPPSPIDLVRLFSQLAEAAAEGPDALRRMVHDEDYAQAFLRSFRDMAPDGKTVGRVDLGAMVRGQISAVAALMPETRVRLTEALQARAAEAVVTQAPVQVDGVMKSVNLRGAEPKIGLETEAGVRIFRIAEGEHDDTIGPKLNRRVRVRGLRRTSDAGETDEWADDILVLDAGSHDAGGE